MLSRGKAIDLIRSMAAASCRCPAHNHNPAPTNSLCAQADESLPDYAFEMACSNIRYGEGVTKEVGFDFMNLGVKKLAVFTDKNIVNLPSMSMVTDSLTKCGVKFDVFDDVTIEPTDVSFKKAIDWSKKGQYDSFLAVGGGSVMDTTKAANLYASHPDADFLDYIAPPLGKGLPINKALMPLIAIPTTAGTGSETTGVSVFDFKDKRVKIGIANRALKPFLGIVDPLHVKTMPNRVAAYSAFDVFCHALESFTAIPYNERKPRPVNPNVRPTYQGSNPISDIWVKKSLAMCGKYMIPSINDEDNYESRKNMLLASTFAGVGFGNAGVHLCHALSYGISGQVRSHQAEGYPTEKPLIPHGLSVVLTAPAVFKWTSAACPERHLEAAALLGRDTSNDKLADAGLILSDVVLHYCRELNIQNGLNEFGYTTTDIPTLVEATLPLKRVLDVSPREKTREDLAGILEDSMTIY